MAGDIRLDFSQVEGFQPIPQGDYVVEVVEVDGPKKSKSGNSMLQLTLQIVGGDYAGRKVPNYFLLLEGEALWRTQKDLEILLDIDMKETGGDVSFGPDDLVGAQAIAAIVPDIWKEEDGGDGEQRPRIKRLKPLTKAAAGLFE
jgi:hypothetical protein